MYFLFETEADNLDDFFLDLEEDRINECCDQKILQRGEEYYAQNLVKSATFNHDKNSLEAIVKRSEKYSVIINLKHGEVHGACDCPYDGVCKHIVATLFYAILENIDHAIIIETKTTGSRQRAEDYLKTLSKQQLIGLVIKYAPEQFYTTIENKSADGDTSKKILEKVKKDIRKAFSDDELLYEMDDFDAAIIQSLSKLSGLEAQLQMEIQHLIIEIINDVDKLIYEGYLYNYYADECYEPSKPFFDFIENYVRTLSFTQKTDFFQKLNEALSRHEYGTFDELMELSKVVYNENDLPLLKNTLMDHYLAQPVSLTVKYYQQVRHLLDVEKRKTILHHIKEEDMDWLLELAGLYKSEKNLNEAIAVTKKWLENDNKYYGNETVYSFYLDLLKDANIDFTDAAMEALSKCPKSSMLNKIVTMPQKNISEFEKCLMLKSPSEMLKYLEENDRLNEALNLLRTNNSIGDYERNDFFKKYKVQFPDEATSFFSNEINKNLPHTGDSYYYAVADAIKNIKAINPGLAKEFLTDIRLNYKRRSNLMKIIAKL
ncbi:MAG: hypothetical protein U0W24_05780 [Bacteroidales bacterium]